MGDLEFPIKFLSCPYCGGTRRLIESVKAEEVEKGKCGEDMPMGSTTKGLAVYDPRKPALSAPQVILLYDICVEQDCGREYLVEVRKTDVPLTTQMKGMPGQMPPPPGGGRR